jgi:hypothetical protein
MKSLGVNDCNELAAPAELLEEFVEAAEPRRELMELIMIILSAATDRRI